MGYEVKQKVESFEREGLGEVRSVMAKTTSQMKTLVEQVEMLDSRVVAADDCSVQFSELACRMELIDARLKAYEEQDIVAWLSCSAAGGVDIKGLMDARRVPDTKADATSALDRQWPHENKCNMPDRQGSPDNPCQTSLADRDDNPQANLAILHPLHSPQLPPLPAPAEEHPGQERHRHGERSADKNQP